MEALWQDLRYGWRGLRANLGFTLVAVLSLALGVGANTAVFSLVDAVLLRPLPVERPDQLIALTTVDHHGDGYPHGLSYADLTDYRKMDNVFAGLAVFAPVPLSLTSGGASERVWGVIAAGNYFELLGVKPILGRAFRPDDDRAPGASPVAVISHGFWQRRFGADPGAVGRTVSLNGHAFTIVGIAPEGFVGTEVIFAPDVWVPVMMHGEVLPGSDNLLTTRPAHNFRALGRLRPGVSLAQAQAAADVTAGQLEQAYPATNKGVRLRLFPQREARIEAGMGQTLALMAGVIMAVVGLVLLISCTNVANLLLARAATRRKEIGIRLALGAGRWRLVRLLLVESVLLALLGGGAGALVAFWGVDLLQGFRPPTDIPFLLALRLDTRVLGYTFALSLVTGVVFGLAPALQASRPDLVGALKGEAAAVGRGARRYRLRDLLVVAQLALSLLLLICAGLFLKSLQGARRVDPGFNPDRALTMSVDLSRQGYDEARGREFFRRSAERVEALPGVESASWASPLPLSFSSEGADVVIEGFVPRPDQDRVGIMMSTVGLKYFQTLGTPLLDGRDFSAEDREGKPGVVIVNETMARRYWPGRGALGRRLSLSGAQGPYLEVVGVARDGKYRQLGEEPRPYMFLPLLQNYRGEATLVVRGAGELAGVRREVQALDSNLAIFDVKTLAEHVAGRALLGPRMGATLLAIFGLVGLLLAAAGIYGVISYTVTQRTREIGVRMALGARAPDVLRMVLAQGGQFVFAGIALGMVAAVALTRVLASLLYGVSSTDPAIFFGVSLLLAGVALLACLLPARRAAKVDPLVALRQE